MYEGISPCNKGTMWCHFPEWYWNGGNQFSDEPLWLRLPVTSFVSASWRHLPRCGWLQSLRGCGRTPQQPNIGLLCYLGVGRIHAWERIGFVVVEYFVFISCAQNMIYYLANNTHAKPITQLCIYELHITVQVPRTKLEINRYQEICRDCQGNLSIWYEVK